MLGRGHVNGMHNARTSLTRRSPVPSWRHFLLKHGHGKCLPTLDVPHQRDFGRLDLYQVSQGLLVRPPNEHLDCVPRSDLLSRGRDVLLVRASRVAVRHFDWHSDHLQGERVLRSRSGQVRHVSCGRDLRPENWRADHMLGYAVAPNYWQWCNRVKNLLKLPGWKLLRERRRQDHGYGALNGKSHHKRPDQVFPKLQVLDNGRDEMCGKGIQSERCKYLHRRERLHLQL